LLRPQDIDSAFGNYGRIIKDFTVAVAVDEQQPITKMPTQSGDAGQGRK